MNPNAASFYLVASHHSSNMFRDIHRVLQSRYQIIVSVGLLQDGGTDQPQASQQIIKIMSNLINRFRDPMYSHYLCLKGTEPRLKVSIERI